MNKYAPTELNEITKEQFEAYEEIRESGATNMFNVRAVVELANNDEDEILTQEVVIGIIKHYQSLMEKFPGVRKET